VHSLESRNSARWMVSNFSARDGFYGISLERQSRRTWL
jgi:hypothetical protein